MNARVKAFLDERKVNGRYVLGVLVVFDHELEKSLNRQLRGFKQEDKWFTFHATDDSAPTALSSTKAVARRFKDYISENLATLCDRKRLFFYRANTSKEFESYSEIMQMLELIAAERQVAFDIHRDRGTLEQGTWTRLKPWLVNLKWTMQEHSKKDAPHLIGVVDYALYYSIALGNRQKK